MPALMLLALAIAELYAVVWVASQVGVLDTIALLILISILGAALVKRAGLGVLRRAQATLAEGRVPHKELVDGLLLLAAGMLLFVPGFVTDALGVLLLLPPVRALLRHRIVRGFRERTAFTVRIVDGFGFSGRFPGGVYDVTSFEANENGFPNGDNPAPRRELDP